jgi:flagellar biosynthesis/type III secretory pathway protein FliH
MSKASQSRMTEIERNRLEAYLNGWDDGYAEGYAKAQSLAAHRVNEILKSEHDRDDVLTELARLGQEFDAALKGDAP